MEPNYLKEVEPKAKNHGCELKKRPNADEEEVAIRLFEVKRKMLCELTAEYSFYLSLVTLLSYCIKINRIPREYLYKNQHICYKRTTITIRLIIVFNTTDNPLSSNSRPLRKLL